jgi:hypothetical protein
MAAEVFVAIPMVQSIMLDQLVVVIGVTKVTNITASPS